MREKYFVSLSHVLSFTVIVVEKALGSQQKTTPPVLLGARYSPGSPQSQLVRTESEQEIVGKPLTASISWASI